MRNYLGGIVYVLVFIIVGSIVFPKANPITISLIVLSFTCIIEFTQLIQSTFMNSLRSYFLIRSLIGKVFNVIDFVFYFVGALIGYGILIIIKKEH